jgi:ABC-type bacteriocin/lantibiotic exporter with double-glycine peptidase domain
MLLYRTFFVEILDRSEKLVPSLTPENFVDEQPMMKPNKILNVKKSVSTIPQFYHFTVMKIKNLTKKFNKFTALQDIDLECKGHSIAFIGPNGCGKTTLIKCILGLNVVEFGDILVNEIV